ncbi:hypothetical protein K2X33_07515 [bacterium]|nr:hypothetical protein [bacterium]
MQALYHRARLAEGAREASPLCAHLSPARPLLANCMKPFKACAVEEVNTVSDNVRWLQTRSSNAAHAWNTQRAAPLLAFLADES